MPARIDLLQRLRRTPLGFGGAPIGNWNRSVDDEEAARVVRHAWDAGVRYFDTAASYGNGLSEHRLGAALRENSADAIIATEVGSRLVADVRAAREQHGFVDALPFAQRRDDSYGGTLRAIEDSLQRLGLARLGVVYCRPNAEGRDADSEPERAAQAVEGAMTALARLRDERSVSGFGIAADDADVALAALQRCDPDLVKIAGRYGLLDQSAVSALLPTCLQRDIGVVIAMPFHSGILATGATPADGSLPLFDGRPAPASIRGRVARLERLCGSYGVPLQAAALQLPRGHAAVVNVIAGMRSRQELEQNLRFARFPIPAPCWQALRSEGCLSAAVPLPG